jgi:glycosyltransferase involved in cell wall biosynthesis
MVSVVVPAHNAAATIGEQLEALSRQVYPGPWEVVVADDGSRDDTARIVSGRQSRFPQLSLVRVRGRHGANAARNTGIRAARGEFILGCDADDVVAPGWLRAMAEALQRFDGVGGGLDEDTINPPEVMRWTPRTTEPWRPARFLPWPVGANYGVRRAVWQALGGFDESWVRGGTEVEFFWRLQLASFQLGFAPDAMVLYRRRSTQIGLLRQFFWYGYGCARLYRTFRAAGMPRFGSVAPPGHWLGSLMWGIRGRGGGRVASFVWIAFRIGLLAGSIRFRVRCV